MPIITYIAAAPEPPCGWTLRRVVLRPQRRPGGGARAVYEPPTDLYETADSVVVRMEVAGLLPEALEVALDSAGRVLTISGHRPDPAAGSPRKYYTMEIECGEFARTVPLPQPIELDSVAASYTDGFLEVLLPKRVPAPKTSRNVPIQ
jgi:HSP20 family molecular chaperone IbpA